jgi:hypothetical protein
MPAAVVGQLTRPRSDSDGVSRDRSATWSGATTASSLTRRRSPRRTAVVGRLPQPPQGAAVISMDGQIYVADEATAQGTSRTVFGSTRSRPGSAPPASCRARPRVSRPQIPDERGSMSKTPHATPQRGY